MKKLRLILIILVWHLVPVIRAQSVNQQPAPDFTVVDIQGATYHLFDLLDQGKSVLLFFWKTSDYAALSYVNSNALNELHETMGPSGSDAIVILGIESDPATSSECLEGQSGCNSTTLANWSQMMDFPIANNENIAGLLGVVNFPSIKLICPDRIQTSLSTLNADQIRKHIDKCPVPSGNVNAGIYYYDSGTQFDEICSSTKLNPVFRLVNLGQQALTQATILVSWQDQLVWSKQWAGNLPRLSGEVITMDSAFFVNCAGELTTQVLTPAQDESSIDNVQSHNFTAAKTIPGPQLLIRIRTDNYGHETYWEIRDDNGEVVEHGGNEAVGPNGGGELPSNEIGPGAYDNSTTYLEYVNLPTTGCYSFHIVDAFGDGISAPSGYYRIYHQSNENIPIISVAGSAFGAYDQVAFYVGDVVDTDTPTDDLIGDLIVSPNPAVDQLTIDWASLELKRPALRIFNSKGQVMAELHSNNFDFFSERPTFNVSNWPSGIYTLLLEDENLRLRKKISIIRS